MSGSLGSWIVRLLLQHNEQYGADLAHIWEGSRLCQLTEFMTYRRPEDPRAQVTARIADKTHTVRVAFDVEGTDEFERSKYGEQPESLTSNLRSVFVLKKLRIRLEQPRARRALSRPPSLLNVHPDRSASVAPLGVSDLLPVVWLDVLDWEVLSGDRYDPIIAEHAQEVGRGEKAAEVAKVLRRWWTGESSSGVPEQPASPSDRLDASPDSIIKRETTAAAEEQSAFDNDSYRITLEEFLAPYLGTCDGKKVKPIPDWIFEVPSDARAQLDAIQVFGVDVEDSEAIEQSYHSTTSREHWELVPCATSAEIPPPAASQKRDESQVSRGSQNDITPPSPPLTEERDKSEVRSEGLLASRSPSLDSDCHPQSASHGTSAAPTAEDSSDGEMVLRPTATRERLGRAAQRALEAFTAGAGTHSRGESETARMPASLSETDEDGLSDYELEQRRKAKRARIQRDSRLSRSSPSTGFSRHPESHQDSKTGTDESKPESSASVSFIEAQRPMASIDDSVPDQSVGVDAVPTGFFLERVSHESSSARSPKRRRVQEDMASQPASERPASPERSSSVSSPSDHSEPEQTPWQSSPREEQKPTRLRSPDQNDQGVRIETAFSRQKRKRPEQMVAPAAGDTVVKSEPDPISRPESDPKRSRPPSYDIGHGGRAGPGVFAVEPTKPKIPRRPKLGGFKPDLRLRGGQSSAWIQRLTSGLRRTSDRSLS